MKTHQEINQTVDDILEDLRTIRRELTMIHTIKADKSEVEALQRKIRHIVDAWDKRK